MSPPFVRKNIRVPIIAIPIPRIPIPRKFPPAGGSIDPEGEDGLGDRLGKDESDAIGVGLIEGVISGVGESVGVILGVVDGLGVIVGEGVGVILSVASAI